MTRTMNYALGFLLLGSGLWVGLSLAPAAADAQPRSPIRIESRPAGAAVFLDDPTSPSLGMTPIRRVRVPRGEHVLIFRLENHQEVRLPVRVRRRETFRAELPALGILDVSSGSSAMGGATVRIDGEDVGVLPHRSTVQSGRHLIQVAKEGFVTLSQWVTVEGAQVLTLPVALERERPRTGSVLVAADVTGAQIVVDGQDRGTAPNVVENLTEGAHRLEVRADGHEAYMQQFVVRPGERLTVSATLRTAAVPSGTLTVVTNPRGAIVSLNGEMLGRSPVTREDVPAGEHILEVTARGREPIQQPITVEAGGRRAVSLTLEASSEAIGTIVINSDAEGATVRIDGEDRGEPPVVIRNAAPGVHAIIVQAPGYRNLRTTCSVGHGRNCEIDARLERLEATAATDGSDDASVATPVSQVDDYEPRDAESSTRRRERRAASTHSAAPLPREMVAVDASIGWPHLIEGRIAVGILDFLDAGFALRTFGRLTEFEGRAKIGWHVIPQLSFGAQARVGGGLGPDDVNNFFLAAEGIGTLHFGPVASVSFWVAADFYTDQYGRMETDAKQRLVDPSRQQTLWLRVGGSFDYAIDRDWNVFVLVEGVPASSSSGRRVLGDILGFGNEDTHVYFRLGGAYKF